LDSLLCPKAALKYERKGQRIMGREEGVVPWRLEEALMPVP
jgi:hypothetical protein